MPHDDGSRGDVDYGAIGTSYARYRQPDPRIATQIVEALGPARSVINIGAGAGSYEPEDRSVTAIEPSASMRSQRPSHLSEAIDASAESLPFPDRSFDASMTTFSVHQWSDLAAGLREMRRVSRQRVVILTGDPAHLDSFWLTEYAPEVIAAEAGRYPEIDAIIDLLDIPCEVVPVSIPNDCIDGFNEAYFGRPERLLDPAARLACSAWSFVDEEAVSRFEHDLGNDLQTGVWDARFGYLRSQAELEGSLRLIVGKSGEIN